MIYKIVRHDKESDDITDQSFSSYDEAYDLLEEIYSDVCCSDADYGDRPYYEIIDMEEWNLIDSHKCLIGCYQNKVGLTDYWLLWLVLFKKSLLLCYVKALCCNSWFDQEALLDYLSSPEGLNKTIVGIILVVAISVNFINDSLMSTYGTVKKKEKTKKSTI